MILPSRTYQVILVIITFPLIVNNNALCNISFITHPGDISEKKCRKNHITLINIEVICMVQMLVCNALLVTFKSQCAIYINIICLASNNCLISSSGFEMFLIMKNRTIYKGNAFLHVLRYTTHKRQIII